jgi:LacI family transcriptional regulator
VSGQSRLQDVAGIAGVSLRTASRVLNDDPRVAADTRERVRNAMLELHFEPNAMARSLRAGNDTTIGLVVESISDPFFAELIDAVEAAMAQCGRSVLVASTHRDPSTEWAITQRMLQRRIAGLLLAPTGEDHSWLSAHDVPVVLVDRGARGVRADLVSIDDRAAAHAGVAHMIGYGHRRIAYIGDTTAIPTSSARLDGYRDALQDAGLTTDSTLIRADGTTAHEAGNIVAALLAQPDPPTAVFSATTRGSLGVVPTLHRLHRTDVAVVGFGDFAMADTIEPAITVIDHSAAALGAQAAERLLARLAERDLPPEHIQIPVALVQRGSGELRP